ncbi:MAG TPA: hypothetical protein VLV15_07165, partial [Dongiaceae bacterium]|nr:hypothetical protein [Dongiaceae bacterium]
MATALVAALAGLVIAARVWDVATAATAASTAGGKTTTSHATTKTTTKKPASSTTHKSAAASTEALDQFASQIRLIEEVGGWSRVTEMLRQLRGRTPPDADLDLMLAWCEARTGDLDSAAARLRLPTLIAAGDDSMPPQRWTTYPWQHEGAWLDGRFDGWHWYVWRTRTEIAAATGHWDTALAAARRAVAARRLAGPEWYVRALCAAHVGLWDEARSSTEMALQLDSTLPEAHELAGLLAWREGRRADARAQLGAALTLDSTYAR